MKIVLDTNPLHQDYLLEGTALVSLTKARERAGYSLLVPAVVVTEHAKHFRDARRVAASQLRQAARDVAALFRKPVETPDLDAVPDDCEQRIRRRLEELGIGVIDHPKVSHEALAARAVSRQPPFSKDGRGYQDTLVWFSVLDLLSAEEPVVLVSSDKIFGDKELDPDLEEEVAATAEGAEVFLAKTLTAAFENHVEPRLQRLESLELALATGSSKLNLAEWLSENLLNIVRDHNTRESAKKDLKPSFEWQAVDRPKFTIARAHAVTDRDAYVRVAVEATGHVGGWQWFQVGHDDFDRDWVEDELPVKVELELMISNEESVSGYTVLSVSPTGVPEPREPDEFDGYFEDDD